MPLKKTMGFGGIIKELQADNKKSGKEKGQGGKPRSPEQMKAVALRIMKGTKK